MAQANPYYGHIYLKAITRKFQTHIDFLDAIALFPIEHINTVPPNCNYGDHKSVGERFQENIPQI